MKRITAEGELDLSSAPLLRQELAQPANHVRLDLAGLSVIDSTGIRLLLEAGAAARANGHTFAISGASPVVVRVLSAAGIEDELSIDSAG